MFISDLHLSENPQILFEKFSYFMNHIVQAGDRLYILGDFFNYWLGRDCSNKFHNDCFKLLKDATDIELAFMVGNRDFLLEPDLIQALGATYLNDPTTIELDNKYFLLSHGDLWCEENINYQRYRRVARNPLAQFCFKHLPKYIRECVAKKLRQDSKKYAGKLEDVSGSVLNTTLNDCEINYIIHGHTHNPICQLLYNEQKCLERHGLCDWGSKGHYLTYSDGVIRHHYF